MLGNALIEVIAAQMIIARSRKNLDNIITNFDDRNIKGATAKVVDHNFLSGTIIKPIRQSCTGRLIDNSQDVKSCNSACVLCCLTLRIIKISRYGNYRIRHLLS